MTRFITLVFEDTSCGESVENLLEQRAPEERNIEAALNMDVVVGTSNKKI
jgi:hypothetical protein